MFSIRECEALSTAHANIAVGPFRRRRRVEHAAGDLLLGWEPKAFVLKCTIGFRDVYHTFSSLCSGSPVLYEFEDFLFDVVVGLSRT